MPEGKADRTPGVPRVGALREFTAVNQPQNSPDAAGVRTLDREMAELLVLLPAAEAAALEEAAKARDLTTGQLVRRLIRDYLDPAVRRTPATSA
jgi:hypothetical protein